MRPRAATDDFSWILTAMAGVLLVSLFATLVAIFMGGTAVRGVIYFFLGAMLLLAAATAAVAIKIAFRQHFLKYTLRDLCFLTLSVALLCGFFRFVLQAVDTEYSQNTSALQVVLYLLGLEIAFVVWWTGPQKERSRIDYACSILVTSIVAALVILGIIFMVAVIFFSIEFIGSLLFP